MPERVFYVAKGYRIASIPIMIGCVLTGFDMSRNAVIGHVDIPTTIVGLLFGLFFSFGSIFVTINAFKCRFEFWKDRIRVVDFWRVREVLNQDLAGFHYHFYKAETRINKSSLHFSFKNSPRTIYITSFYGDEAEFNRMIEERFKDLTWENLEEI